ncbi:DUF7405 family protein [Halopiger djelfimassiliensis]|uniref:DUF7405 family protein n=1 Tax=Halopiger djelfimassiliensis TaxID=1293047 RepID=UPI000677AEA5|nr:Tat pathway signal protein [Halopiger djelfimassiliensis]
MSGPDRGYSRRAFVRSAVAVGGAAGLAACLGYGSEDPAEIPQADRDPADLPERQHAWNEFLGTDDHGNVVPPEHHVMLGLNYVGDGPHDADDERAQLEDAFTTLERAFRRGNEGLVFTVGYSPAYFDRFDDDPDGLELPDPEPLTAIEDPEFDEYDALVHLASDHGHAVLSAEQALLGEQETVNDRSVEGTLEGIFELADRRPGFIGDGLPADEQAGVSGIPDSEPVPEDAPLFMGFKSGFRHNQAPEDRVTIDDGPFAGGTTTHLSRLRLHLRQWYEQDSRTQRVSKMFSPAHADDDRIEGAGHNLGDASGVETATDPESDARSRGVVGHAQKAARAREDGTPVILRRDFNSTKDDEAALEFLSHQRTIADFVRTRDAMTGTDLDVPRANSGILQYLTVRRRGNYLVPPRRHRSLPTPSPE